MVRSPAVSLYGWLLRQLLPSEIYRADGAEMVSTFASQLSAAARRRERFGIMARAFGRLPAVLLAESWDYVLGAGGSDERIAEQESRMPMFAEDLRNAFRSLRSNPGFTAVAVATLALGIGATTAIFSAVNGMLLRPLPYPESDHLVTIWQDHRERGGSPEEEFNPEDFHDLRRRSSMLEEIAAMTSRSMTLTGRGEAEQVDVMMVSHDYFDVLRARPELGRTFLESDEIAGEVPVVLSHGLWQRAFGGDPNVVGSRIVLNEERHTIVGVVPADFRAVGGEPDLWRWLAMPDDPETDTRDFRVHDVFGRLTPGAGIEQANAELAIIARDLQAEQPASNAGVDFRLAPMDDRMVEPVRPALLALLGAVGFVLLITCVNIANLLLARASVRSSEMAVRAALGAGRGRLVRQLLTENSLLALLGGAVGVLVAKWSLGLLVGLAPADTPRLEEIGIDVRVLGFSLIISLLCGLLFGVLPAFHGARPALSRLLSTGARSGSSAASHRVRSALVVAQLAVTVVLVTAAGLMMRSFFQLQSVDPGFRTENVLVADLSLMGPGWDSPAREALFEELVQRLESRAGVRSVGAVSALPFREPGRDAWFEPERSRAARPGERPIAGYRIAIPGYFQTMGIPVLRGRLFDARDRADGARVVVLNETAARTFWPGEDPIGKQFTWQGGGDEPITVSGVVGDVRHEALDRPPQAEVYLSGLQFWTGQISIVVHTDSDPLAVAPALRSIVRAVNPNVPVFAIASMDTLLGRSIAMPRLYLVLFAAFGTLALVLAVVGIYGVTSRAVGERRHEIGVRMAVGAGSGQVLRMVLKRTLSLTLPGLGLGILGALVLTRVLTGLLFELSPTDPLTFAAMAVVLGSASVAAAYLPARRAARVDPIVVLRSE